MHSNPNINSIEEDRDDDISHKVITAVQLAEIVRKILKLAQANAGEERAAEAIAYMGERLGREALYAAIANVEMERLGVTAALTVRATLICATLMVEEYIAHANLKPIQKIWSERRDAMSELEAFLTTQSRAQRMN